MEGTLTERIFDHFYGSRKSFANEFEEWGPLRSNGAFMTFIF